VSQCVQDNSTDSKRQLAVNPEQRLLDCVPFDQKLLSDFTIKPHTHKLTFRRLGGDHETVIAASEPAAQQHITGVNFALCGQTERARLLGNVS
jgi:hypothetical protein